MALKHSLSVSASHIVRLYLWDMMQDYMPDTWGMIDTGTGRKIPILPVQEQPEQQTSNRPYIVYTYDVLPTSDVWQYQTESMYLVIFSQSSAVISSTTKLMTRLFNKYDVTAREINKWVQGPEIEKYFEGAKEWLDEYRNYRFKTVRVAGVAGQQPTPQEAGRVDSAITLELTYVELDMGMSSNN